MKKTNIILILVAMISLFSLGGVIFLFGDSTQQEDQTKSSLENYQDNYVTNAGMNKEIIVKVKENFSTAPLHGIYDVNFQKSVRETIDALIEEYSYDEDNPLVIYNPFLTNTQSLYVYFETEEPYAVSYSIHTPDAEFEDFGGYVIPNQPDTSKVHEFQIIGLIPEETNMITIRMMDKDGVVKLRRFYYYNEHEVAIDTIELETSIGTKEVQNADKTFSIVPASEESVSEGVFVTFPDKNEISPYLRMYDKNGVQRGEISLETFGTKKIIVYEDFMFYRVSEEKIVGVNRLGQVMKVYTSENYLFGEDFCLDKNNDFLVLASDKRQNSVDDCIILLDRETLAITELVDLGDLLPQYKVKCKKSNGILDWISLNSIDFIEGNRILVTASATDTIIKIRRLYNEPKIAFLAGDITAFEGTSYESLFLRPEGDFELHANVNQVLYQEYDKIRETRLYIEVLNNNEDATYAKEEEPYAYYYYYLVDEAEGGSERAGSLRLMDKKVLPEMEENGSIQWYGDHFIVASDMTATFYEYDSEFNLITKFHYEEPVKNMTEEEMEYEEDHPSKDDTVSFLRVSKHDFINYYFAEEPVLILPAESELEENLSENE